MISENFDMNLNLPKDNSDIKPTPNKFIHFTIRTFDFMAYNIRQTEGMRQ